VTFQLSYKRSLNYTLDGDSFKLVLLSGVREYMMETLNIISNGYIYQLDYDDIKRIFNRHSRSSRKKDRRSRGLVSQSSNPTTHIKNELEGLIEDMKTDILHSLSMQMDNLQIKRNKTKQRRHWMSIVPNALKNIL
jgi:hypothetical protein